MNWLERIFPGESGWLLVFAILAVVIVLGALGLFGSQP